jgi:hypothetical protein
MSDAWDACGAPDAGDASGAWDALGKTVTTADAPYGLPDRLGCFAGLGDAEMMKFLGAKGTKLNRTLF